VFDEYARRAGIKWWKHVLLALLGSYLVALFCLFFLPWTQAFLLYLHWVKWPYHFEYTDLHTLAMPNARNIQVRRPFSDRFARLTFASLLFARHNQIKTADGETLYGYHLLPAGPLSVHISNLPEPQREAQFDLSLQSADHPIFIFMHGNGATRAFFRRVELIKALSSHVRRMLLLVSAIIVCSCALQFFFLLWLLWLLQCPDVGARYLG
jgi:hypothetical protein